MGGLAKFRGDRVSICLMSGTHIMPHMMHTLLISAGYPRLCSLWAEGVGTDGKSCKADGESKADPGLIKNGCTLAELSVPRSKDNEAGAANEETAGSGDGAEELIGLDNDGLTDDFFGFEFERCSDPHWTATGPNMPART